MAKTIKEGDFVQIDYTGRLKNEGYIFDTTEEKTAKENNIFNPEVRYGSITLCVGKGLVLRGLDEALVGKEPGKDYAVEVNSGDTFGKRSASLIKLVPISVFKKQGIRPMPGLQVTVDDSMGTVKTVSGGRVIVDFNHPLAGKDLVYDLKVRKFVDDVPEQIKSILELKLNIRKEDAAVNHDKEKGSAVVTLNTEIPEEIRKNVADFIKECTGLKKVSFTANQKAKEQESNAEQKSAKKGTSEKKREPETPGNKTTK